MDLDFDDQQEALRALAREVCDDYATIDVVRAMEDDPQGVPEALWKQLGETGLVGIRIAEEHGGGGQGLLEAAILYEELGRALAPVPHLPSAIVAAGILARAGNVEQRRWLARIADGSAILTLAWLEPDGGCAETGIAARALPDPAAGGYRIEGVKRHVPFASAAERAIVVARTPDETIDLFLVDLRGDGIRLTQQHSLASDTQYRVDFEGAVVTDADRIGAPGTGWATLSDVLHEAAVLNAAWANGACEEALARTTQYAKDRVQFGKPIGAFQSIAHYLADARTHLDGSRTLTHQAAWTADQGRSLRELAPMAKLFACQSFRDTTAVCQQIFGGVGFTVEYDIQLYFRRAKQLQLSWWDTRHLEERIASGLFDAAP